MKGKKPIILIVDDETSIISSLKRTFMNENIHIITAVSGEQGLSILEGTRVDIVMSDQHMPGMDGIDFIRKVRIQYPKILTIILTAHGNIETAVKAINEAGVYKFIIKPWNDEELIITVKRAFELLEMSQEKNELAQEIKAKDMLLSELEREHPGITKIERAKNGRIVLK